MRRRNICVDLERTRQIADALTRELAPDAPDARPSIHHDLAETIIFDTLASADPTGGKCTMPRSALDRLRDARSRG